jgi:type I restriction enzyme S subunit
VQSVKLKELCEFEKGSTGLAKAEPGDYPLVTTGAVRKSCDTYQFVAKAVCIPLVSSTGHGHASLKNVHYQEGKFALGSILVALTSKDDNRLDIQFLHLYLSQLKDQVLVPLMSGAANVALSVKKIQDIEIPLPSIKRQREIVERFKSIVVEEDELNSELTHQQTLLKKLRQQILQEAIEGKLTADWRAQNPDVEPASELLKRIAAEKAQLIKDKKIKSQKTLPSITDEEKPFELPQGWEWCRLANVGFVLGGLTKNAAKRSEHKTLLPYLRVANVYANRLDLTEIKEIGVAESEIGNLLLEKNDLLVVEGNGSRNQVGRIARWDGSIDPCIHQNHVIKVRLVDIENVPWVLYWYLSPAGRTLVEDQARTSTGLYNLSTGKVANLPLATPPLAEQQAIVTKVENLLALCDQLETQITQNQSHAEQLMQAVLKEAFSHNSEAKPESAKPEAIANA